MAAHAGAGPSYDCRKAATPTEIAICGDEQLSLLDRKLSRAYRDFYSALPPDAKSAARRMQQLWLRGREERCADGITGGVAGSSTSPYMADMLGEMFVSVPYELVPRPEADTVSCIGEYYGNAIDALERGALSTYVFFRPDRRKYRIGLAGLDYVRLASEGSAEGDGADTMEYDSVFPLVAGVHGNEYPLATALLSDEHAKDVLGLRLFMTGGGSVHFAMYEYENYAGGRCGHSTELYQRFFSPVQGGIEWYRGDPVNALQLAYAQHACGVGYEEYSGWDAEDENLVFRFFDGYDFYYWVTLPVFERKRVHRESREYVDLDPVDRSTESLWGRPYEELYQAVRKDIRGDGNTRSGSDCAAVASALDKYFDILRTASAEKVTVAQALFIGRNVLQGRHIGDLSPDLLIGARYFLFYLEKAREVDDWANKLQRATDRYPMPNHHYFMMPEPDWTDANNPFIQEGFYSDHGCFLNTQTRSFGLEEWIYRFWARRARAGNLEQTEAILRRLISLHEHASTGGEGGT